MNIKEEIEKCRKQINDLIWQASEERIKNGRSRLFRRLCRSIDDLEGMLDDLEQLKSLEGYPRIGFVTDLPPDRKNGVRTDFPPEIEPREDDDTEELDQKRQRCRF